MAYKTFEEFANAANDYKDKLKTLEEEWKVLDVFDIAPIYKISNHGRLKKIEEDKMIEPSMTDKGYPINELKLKDGRGKKFLIHRLVAATFIPIPQRYFDEGYTMDTLHINHKNGIKYHNAICNLEWCTPKENAVHAHATGLAWKVHGENNFHAKFPIPLIHEVCKYLEAGESNMYIKEVTGVTDAVIYALARHEIHKDIVCQYKIVHRTNDLSDETIHDICKDIISKKISVYKIAEKYGTSADYLYRLIRGIYRTDITSQYPELKNSIKLRLSDETVKEICYEIKDGKLSMQKIADKYGMSLEYIKGLKYGKIRKDISKDIL